MADVSVEFGAKDTGLENTLKTIQDQLVALDGELKSGTLSFDEINKKMREAAQAEKLHASFGGTKDQIEALGLSFKQTKPEIEKFTENQKEAAQETQKASTSFQTMSGEMFELKAALENGNLSADEFDKTLRRLNKLEDIQQKMDAFKQSTTGAGESADQASPEVEELGTDIKQTGKEAEDFGEKSKGGFLKMSSAVAAGQLAAEAAMAGIRAAINLAKGAIDEFGAALDLGGRLSDLSARTGEAEGNLLLLERAFQNSGAGAEAVGPAINKLQNFMQGAAEGGAAQTAAMEKLGLSFEELSGKTPIQQLETFAQRISGIEDPTLRTALAMDVFGRSGGELLPLLTNFSSELGTAQGQLGGMVDIMNHNAATFDSVGDKIAIVQGKFMEFAAGILDRTVPALDAITEGLSRIDAAALGQKLADAFLGGAEAMQGFQAAVDAFTIGEFGKAFELIFESIKLQVLMTGNEIYKNLVAAFQTAADFIKTIFAGDGMLMTYINGAFQMLGLKAGAALAESISSALPDDFIFGGLKQAMSEFAASAKEDANMLFNAMYHDADLLKGQLASAAAALPETFKKNHAETQGIFGDLEERSAALKAKQDEITAAVAKTNEEKGKGAPIDAQTTAEAEKQNQINAEIAAEKAKMEGLQNALNVAIESGNALEQETIQKLIDAENAKARIKKLTEDYIATGLGEKEADQLATNLVNSEIAAKGVAGNTGQVKTNLGDAGTEAQTVKGLMDDIANSKMEASPERLKERTKDARTELESMKNFIGEDLSKMPLDDIIDKLGLDPDGKLKTTDEKLRAVEGAVKDIGGADPADITPDVDLVGVNDELESVKGYLADIGKKKTDATPEIDQKDVAKQAKTAMDTIEKTMKKTPAEIALNAEKSVGEIRKSLAKEIDLALSSSKGTEHLSSIDKLVDAIKVMVVKIEGKLPMQALAY